MAHFQPPTGVDPEKPHPNSVSPLWYVEYVPLLGFGFWGFRVLRRVGRCFAQAFALHPSNSLASTERSTRPAERVARARGRSRPEKIRSAEKPKNRSACRNWNSFSGAKGYFKEKKTHPSLRQIMWTSAQNLRTNVAMFHVDG